MLIFLLVYIELFANAKMLKETDIEEEIGFDFIIFVIDGILIGEGGSNPLGYAYGPYYSLEPPIKSHRLSLRVKGLIWK